MARNTMGDLNDHLFMALERINVEDHTPEDLAKELERAKVVATVASQIIANGNLVLKAKIAQNEYCRNSDPMPKMLNG